MLLSEVGEAGACVHDLCAIVVGWRGAVHHELHMARQTMQMSCIYSSHTIYMYMNVESNVALYGV